MIENAGEDRQIAVQIFIDYIQVPMIIEGETYQTFFVDADKSFSKESRITLMLMVASTTIIYEVGIYIINIIKLNASIELALFLKILAIETIYNTIITIIMYPIIQRLGEKLESTFKPQTRGMYF